MSPPGRYAHWVNWKILGASKEGWQALHTVFSYTFVILSVFHLFTINWKTFLSYLKTKKQNGLNKKREFYIATVLTILFFFGIIYSAPPFKYVMDFGEYLTESWESAEEEPPVPHAELLTLAELDVQLKDFSLEEITNNLNLYEINFNNTNLQTLSEIAEINETTPLAVYQQIIRKPESQKQGLGIGKKAIEDLAKEQNKNIDEVFKILNENKIKAEKGQTLREISENNNITPKEIYDLIFAE